jgi:acetylornithine/succinyldiaminopimelate/putrescine aminotransferase
MNLAKNLLGSGPYLYQGKRRLLDLTANNLTSNLGYASKNVVEKAIHNSLTRPQSHLKCLEHLHRELPSFLDTTVFAPSNADAKSLAIFTASYLNLKSEILFARDFLHEGDYLLETLSSKFSRFETGALWLEPVIVKNGLYRFSSEYVRKLVRVCRDNDILLICDETLTGMGRTGYLWAHQYYNLEPDMMVFGTNVASGFPMAGMVVPKITLQNLKRPIVTHSLPNETTCKMCESTFESIQGYGWREFATTKGKFLKKQLTHLKIPSLKTLQQCGLMLYLEFDKKIKTPTLQKTFLKNGLLLEVSDNNSCLLLPPLDIRYNELDDLVYRFEKATMAI